MRMPVGWLALMLVLICSWSYAVDKVERVGSVNLPVTFAPDERVSVTPIEGTGINVVTTVVSDSDGDCVKTMERAIDELKDQIKRTKELQKIKDKELKADPATAKKYAPQAKATKRDKLPQPDHGLLTWSEMLEARKLPHVSAPYDDPGFVPTCKGGTCKRVVATR